MQRLEKIRAIAAAGRGAAPEIRKKALEDLWEEMGGFQEQAGLERTVGTITMNQAKAGPIVLPVPSSQARRLVAQIQLADPEVGAYAVDLLDDLTTACRLFEEAENEPEPEPDKIPVEVSRARVVEARTRTVPPEIWRSALKYQLQRRHVSSQKLPVPIRLDKDFVLVAINPQIAAELYLAVELKEPVVVPDAIPAVRALPAEEAGRPDNILMTGEKWDVPTWLYRHETYHLDADSLVYLVLEGQEHASEENHVEAAPESEAGIDDSDQVGFPEDEDLGIRDERATTKPSRTVTPAYHDDLEGEATEILNLWTRLKSREESVKRDHSDTMKAIREEENGLLKRWRDYRAGRQAHLFRETPPPTDEERQAALDGASEEAQTGGPRILLDEDTPSEAQNDPSDRSEPGTSEGTAEPPEREIPAECEVKPGTEDGDPWDLVMCEECGVEKPRCNMAWQTWVDPVSGNEEACYRCENCAIRKEDRDG